MAHPYAKKVLIPELGPKAWILLENPWNLPQEKPLPAKFMVPEGETLPLDLIDEYNEEIERRARRKLALSVLEWEGIIDAETGEPLPLPKDDPSVYDKLGRIVPIKIGQALMALELDEEWDPTKRPTPPVAEKAKPTPAASKNAPLIN